MPKSRNPVARSPLLRKGGAHVKSKTGQRLRSRLNTQDAIDEWWDEQQDQQQEETTGEQTLPDFIAQSLLSVKPQYLSRRLTN